MRMGPVSLAVRDAERAVDFYARVLGLGVVERDAGPVAMGVDDEALVELVADPEAPRRPTGTTGLYHLAILVPDRRELGRSVRRLVAERWRLAGAADHLVSEAIYLSDPEGNGIEVYADRPREQWRYDGDEVRMATLPLDLGGLVEEVGERSDDGAGLAADARIGHVHLNVADLDDSERFYGALLGLDVTARGYPGALFMAADAYHHHVGLNVWQGRGAPRPPDGATGLRRFEIQLRDERAVAATVERLRADGQAIEERGGAFDVADPSGNRLRLRVA